MRAKIGWFATAMVGVGVLAAVAVEPASATFPGGNGRLVVSVDGDLWTVEADGSDARPLLERVLDDSEPRVSPDGSRVAFRGEETSGTTSSSIWVVNMDGTGLLELVPAADAGPPVPLRGLEWSPDGSTILFHDQDTDFSKDVFSVPADGSGPAVNLTPGPHDDIDAHWSPDGSRIVFARWLNGQGTCNCLSDLWTMAPDGSDQRQLTTTDDIGEHDADWSVDDRIVFQRDGLTANSLGLGIVDSDGGNYIVPAVSNLASDPSFAPDGSAIVFVVPRPFPDLTRDVWTMAADGSAPTNVTARDINETQPEWSPDSSKIAIVTELEDVWTMNRDGSGLVEIPFGGFTQLGDWQALQNQPPVAVDDGPLPVAEGGALAGNVLANDFDPDGDPITAALTSGPAHGSLDLNSDGSFTYTHDGSETVADSFEYVASDGTATSAAALVTIDVTPVNDAPVAIKDAYQLAEGSTLVVNGVLDNDRDAEGDSLVATVVRPPRHGTLDLSGDGTFTYAHDGSETTADSFTYRASDGEAQSNAALVVLTVDPADDPEHSVGLVNPDDGMWRLRTPGGLVSLLYGNPGDVPFVGDWDCDGDETPGLMRPSDAFIYLRNSSTTGIADIEFFYGNPDDVPLAGDFDGDGCDTISVYRPGEQRIYLINRLAPAGGSLGGADFSFTFGDPGDVPVVGDWDADGIDEIGLFRPSSGSFFWRDTLRSGTADGEISFGSAGDLMVAGDYGGVDGADGPGLFRPAGAAFFLRTGLGAGSPVIDFPFGRPGWVPVSGAFG